MFDFDTEEGDTARENDKYFEYALKLEHREIGASTFRLVGYYRVLPKKTAIVISPYFF